MRSYKEWAEAQTVLYLIFCLVMYVVCYFLNTGYFSAWIFYTCFFVGSMITTKLTWNKYQRKLEKLK
jgi:hypothetical protein